MYRERENCGSREGRDMALNYRVCASTSAKTKPCEGSGGESLRAKDKCGGIVIQETTGKPPYR